MEALQIAAERPRNAVLPDVKVAMCAEVPAPNTSGDVSDQSRQQVRVEGFDQVGIKAHVLGPRQVMLSLRGGYEVQMNHGVAELALEAKQNVDRDLL